MKKIIIVVVGLFLFGLFSCQDPGTVKKFEGYSAEDKIPPCVIDGDTLDLYQYYYSGEGFVWIARTRGSGVSSANSLNYKVGKTEKSVILINGDMFRRIKGDIICENDSIVVIKRTN